MRITGWHIDGFGLFNEARVAELAEGLTIVHGPNEAGKSTTLAFIRGVLFGFPSGNTKERKYPPLHGGSHGGRLFLEDGEGSWTIGRTGGRGGGLTVTMPDGSAGVPEDLARLMGFADKEIFRNIFAFDLEDLDMRSLDSDAVKDRIFASTQIGAAKVSPSQARKLLDAQIAKLLKPSARSALINRLKSELVDIERQMREAQKAADSYPRAESERDKLGVQVGKLREAQGVAEAEIGRLQKLESLWPDWFQRGQAEQELAGIDAPDDVPDDIEERLTDAVAGIRETRGVLATIEKERAGQEKRLARIVVDDRLVDVEPESERLFAEVSAYEENLRQLSALESGAEVEKKTVEDALTNLGPGWDRERIASFNASIPAADEVASWGDKVRGAKEAKIEAERALADATQRATGLSDERASADTEVAACGEVASGEDLDDLESRSSSLKALIVERGAAEARVESAEQLVANLQATNGATAAPGATTPLRLPLYGFAALLIVAAAIMTIVGQLPAGAALAVAAVGAGVLGYLAGKAGASPAVDAPTDPRVKSTSDLLETRRIELERIADETGILASSLGLPRSPTPAQVEERVKQLVRQREKRAALDRLSRDADRLAERERRVREELQVREAALASKTAGVEALIEEWGRWKAGKGISEPMVPETMTAVFQAVKECRDALGRLVRVEGQIGDLGGKVKEFERCADDVLAKVGDKPGTRGSAMAAALSMLHKRVLSDQKSRDDREGLQTGLEGTTRELDKATAELAEAEQRRQEVLDEVSVVDEVELRTLVKRVRRRRELNAEIRDCRERIDASLGMGAPADEMRSQLSDGHVEEWRAEKATGQDRVHELDKEREEAVRAHELAVQEVSRISESSDVARLEIAAEGLRQELAEAAGRWQTLALARALIDETVSLNEKNNQGPVVDRASALFKSITADHYSRLFAHEGMLEVENDTGERIDVGSLSTGAAQQVYLCLRLGLAEVEASKRTSIPLIMDEVLVNFDEERALGVAEAILDITERHQVLMFTCHPHTVGLMKKICGDVRVVELDRFVGSPR